MIKKSAFFLGIIVLLAISILIIIACDGNSSNNGENNNINGFYAEQGTYEILDSYQGKTNVLKIYGNKLQQRNIAFYDLSKYKNKLITIELTIEVRREGAAGNIAWHINNDGVWPTLTSVNNAEVNIWHKMSGKLTVTPTDNNPYIYLANWQNNTPNTIYYIANPVITIIDGDGLNPDFSLTPLKTSYADNFLIGNSAPWRYFQNEGRYFDLMKHHCNLVLISNGSNNMAPIEKGGEYRWGLDDTFKAAKDNGFTVHGFNIIWHEQSMPWLTEGSKDDVKQNLQKYVFDVVDHYKGKFPVWYIINEGIQTFVSPAEADGDWKDCIRKDEYNMPNPWSQKLGADYIELAFRAARDADPNAKLYYNDFGLEDPSKALVVKNMVQDINTRYKQETSGTRNLIEGVGSQAHIWDVNINIDEVKASLDILASLGIEISITELDVQGIYSNESYVEGNDTILSLNQQIAQGITYARLTKLYREYPCITSVSFHGLDDRFSWLSATNPLLFDRNLNAKKAFYAVSDPDGFLSEYE